MQLHFFQPKQIFLTMGTNSFQQAQANETEVLNITSMLQIKGGTDDKRASRPTKGLSNVRTTENNCKKP